MLLALLLTAAYMAAEVAGGLLSGSLALLADAGHMLADVFGLFLAWLGFRLARRPADARRSYGYHRLEVLAAFVNGVSLFAIVAWILVEAARRFLAPVEVLGGLMLAVAVGGLAVNAAAFAILQPGAGESLNLRGAALHVLGDLLGSLAAIVAAGVILATGWTPIDPLLSVLVALLVLRSAWFVVREAGHVLLEGTPASLDVAGLRAELAEAVPEVEDIHHVHAWSLSSARPLITLHASVREGADHGAVLGRIKALLAARYGVTHSVVQIEPGACPDEEPGGPSRGARAGSNPREERSRPIDARAGGP